MFQCTQEGDGLTARLQVHVPAIKIQIQMSREDGKQPNELFGIIRTAHS